MAPSMPPGVSANEGTDELAEQHLTHLKTLLDSPSGPFSTIFPGKTSEGLLDPNFLAEAMYMAQLLAKDDIIADLSDQIAEKDVVLDELKAEIDANTKILALKDKKIADLEHKLKGPDIRLSRR
ncbi:hypothetical protein HBH98_101870 [Parastagonospora nodorum]|nr:hypothetical protein HBH98_101870 [Parastagonospora nodorum]KAH4382403.1 hypothetical protein HBH97_084980 [Parastagonospora nodorum]KAH4398533.1 hypothetical protein HBH99_114810 [Parastagonospora nodorum]KAH5300162.1 hypothetical protein HBI11_148180 [Parastagonospora nodorum]KAH5385516.1 hypothetical protein HBI33_089780 [Parastagonospora nodorum]